MMKEGMTLVAGAQGVGWKVTSRLSQALSVSLNLNGLGEISNTSMYDDGSFYILYSTIMVARFYGYRIIYSTYTRPCLGR
jgi:hypothetical protein